MPSLIELTDDDLSLLDKASAVEQISRSEVIHNALLSYANRLRWPELDAAFGLWKERGEDGLVYQERMRAEWDRTWER